MGKKRRRFSVQFKKDAVALVTEGGISVAQASRDLDIYETTLRNWIKKYPSNKGEGGEEALTSGEQQELRRLRRENKTLKTEREILKKAAVYSRDRCNMMELAFMKGDLDVAERKAWFIGLAAGRAVAQMEERPVPERHRSSSRKAPWLRP